MLLFLLLAHSLYLFSDAGITYTQRAFSYSDYIFGTTSIHILEIDPKQYTLQPVKALDNGIGRETVLSIAKRYSAKAAINAGFFAIDSLLDGRACGALKIHDWHALPFKPRGCIAWNHRSNDIIFDRILVDVLCKYHLRKIKIDGLNRGRKEAQAILYTPSFHKTTLTRPDGVEVIVKNNIIKDIRRSLGSSVIPQDGFVLSLQNSHPLCDTFTVGEKLTYSIEVHSLENHLLSQELENLDYIIGGTPLLIHNGQCIKDFSPEKTLNSFITNRRARSAIGLLPNKHIILVVIDKLCPFDGMTLYELQDLMLTLGCTEALNLDGGRSSTLVLDDQIINSPTGDEDEDDGKKTTRKVSDAIIVTEI